nr:MAG TPA: hypothetical protein [Caudoviricetes sp.]
MVTNKYEVIIGKINYTHYCVMPLKGANLLDERLDEVYLPLRHIPVEVFQPLTPVKIIIHNKVHFNENVAYSKDKTLYFVVANDNNIVESPVGSGKYNHDIYLVETTKVAECIIVDSLTYTNDLGRNYAKNPKPITPTDVTGTHQPNVPDTYVTPMLSGNSFTFVSVNEIYGTIADENAAMSITFPNGEIIYPPDPYNNSYTVSSLETGIYNVGYSFSRDSDERKGSCDFIFTVVDNYYPLKRLTMKDIINRLLMLAKNLYEGETPEIALDETQAELFDKIYAPEMSFTQKTLRECLQDCGSILHGEPRLTPIEGATSAPYYTLTYDMYGGTETSDINVVPYITKTVAQVINGYCTSIDSNAQNLVNQLDYLQGGGTITEPYVDGYKTLRTETQYVRVSDTNGIIMTQYPVNKVEKILCGYIPPNGTQKNIDITPYLFESVEYNSQLSSYKEDYPFSKAYGLFYTQGQKNIGGLNFKVDGAVAPAFQDYAIVNILKKATGNNNLNINSETGFPILAFQITYKPIYSVRLSQTKPYYPEYKRQADLIYNQQSNLMETQYYGENLKGVVARLGTVEKTYTFNLAKLSQLPKAGQMYDEDYYISAVSWELMPTLIRVTLGLSKDFNRLSEYVGVSSNKRLYEVSERQAYDRNILYKEYMVYGDEETPDGKSLIGAKALSAIRYTFLQNANIYSPLSNVLAWGGTYKNPTKITTTVDVRSKTHVYAYVSGGDLYMEYKFDDDIADLADQRKITVTTEYYYTATEGGNTLRDTVTRTPKNNTEDVLTMRIYELVSYNVISASYVDATGSTPLPNIQLPVIASALGNSMVFSWRYEDNYSAGAQINYAKNGELSGYWQDNTPYCDYYGKIYYYNFLLQQKGVTPSNITEQTDIGTSLPNADPILTSNGYISTLEYKPYIIRKDSREVLQVNAQIENVTNRKNMIIGSALASCCPLVRGADENLQPKAYVFDERLNKFINHVEGSINVNLAELTPADITAAPPTDGQFAISFVALVSGKSWAIVTKQTTETVEVEDETGEVTEQVQVKGGDVLIGANEEVTAGQTITFYATKKHKIFER